MRTARWTLAIYFLFWCDGFLATGFGPLIVVMVAASIVWGIYFPLPPKRTGRGLGPPPGWRPKPRSPLSLSGSPALIIREL